MKKSTRILLVSIISILIISILIGMVFLFVNQYSSNKVFADYVSDIQTVTNAIVNFNQLQTFTPRPSNISGITVSVVDGWKIKFSGSYGVSYNAKWRLYNDYISLSANHKYYFKVNANSYNYLYLVDGANDNAISSIQNDFIYNANSNLSIYVAYELLPNTNYNLICGVNIIDLTTMFGVGNEPNLEQAQELFTADYYPYTLGTAVSYDNLNSWADGYSSALNNLQVIFSGTLLQSNCYANIGTLYTLSEYNSIGMRIDNTRQLSEFYFNYPTALSKGDVVSLKFENLDINLGDNENNPFSIQIGYYSNGEFIVITSFNPNNSSLDRTYWFEGAYNGIYKNAYVSFNAPDNMQRIYFRTTHKGYAIRGLEINAKTSNTAFDLSSAQQRGWDLAEEYYTNYINEYYSQGGEGYTQIYQAGYQNGNNGGNVFLDSWEWVGSLFTGIGNILTLQIVPGLPLGIFVALPLLVGLIFFIVKISKG